jgi:hypothetical protein
MYARLWWKDARQFWPIWVFLNLKPAVATLPEWDLQISVGVALVAGASVFGLENHTHTQRFLTHHGAQPGLVWMMKLAVWGVGVAAIWGPLILMAKLTITMGNVGPAGRQQWYHMVLIVPLFFSVSQLCGMAIRRGITAVVIALVIALVMLIPLGALIASHMRSSRSAMLLIPNMEGYIETNDRNEVARRALVQVLALRERSWAPTAVTTVGSRSRKRTIGRNPWTSILKSRPWKAMPV